MSHVGVMDVVLPLLLLALVVSPALALWHAGRLTQQLAAALERAESWAQEASELRIQLNHLRQERDDARGELDEAEIRLDEARRLAQAAAAPAPPPAAGATP